VEEDAGAEVEMAADAVVAVNATNKNVPPESLRRRPVTEETHDGTVFTLHEIASAGNRACVTAEALGCGDATNLRTTLGGGRPRNLGPSVLGGEGVRRDG
jgi:hypothetical protein